MLAWAIVHFWMLADIWRHANVCRAGSRWCSSVWHAWRQTPRWYLAFLSKEKRFTNRVKATKDCIKIKRKFHTFISDGIVNVSIPKAAGPEFWACHKRICNNSEHSECSGCCTPSKLSVIQKEGDTHVSHAVGPNMYPKGQIVAADYVKECKLLGDTYSSLSESSASIFKAWNMGS